MSSTAVYAGAKHVPAGMIHTENWNRIFEGFRSDSADLRLHPAGKQHVQQFRRVKWQSASYVINNKPRILTGFPWLSSTF